VTPAALRQLMLLAEARRARDLARLDALLAEDRRLVAEIAELGRTAVLDAAADQALPPDRQGLRLIWADQRIRAARLRQAALALTIRQARTAAAQSLGKHSSLETLVERAERAALLVRAAKAEREAPPELAEKRL